METLKELSTRLGLPFTENLPPPNEAAELVRKLSISFAKKSEMAPVRIEDGRLLVITSRPLDHHAVSDLRLLFEMPVKLMVAPPDVITEFINRAYEISAGSAEDILGEVEGEADKASLQDIAQELEGPTDLLDTDEEAPIVRLLNSLLQQAIKEKASDIHIESFASSIAVRMRIDGILYSVLTLPRRIQPQLASRVKIMAGLDIAEKRLPQDGRIKIKIAEHFIDLRVSVIPTSFGERIVMRLLDKSSILIEMEDLGLVSYNYSMLNDFIQRSNGIILVTGPTGSGKTFVATEAIKQAIASNQTVIYTSPLKALSNTKYMEFSQHFGSDQVGILTGDRRDNAQAPLLIMTTEILRNILYDATSGDPDLRLHNLGLVILDESQYLADPERGVVWEETLILCPLQTRLLLLSASIGNPQELAEWLTSIRPATTCQLIRHTKRSVPLRGIYMHSTGQLVPLFDNRDIQQRKGYRFHPETKRLFSEYE